MLMEIYKALVGEGFVLQSGFTWTGKHGSCLTCRCWPMFPSFLALPSAHGRWQGVEGRKGTGTKKLYPMDNGESYTSVGLAQTFQSCLLETFPPLPPTPAPTTHNKTWCQGSWCTLMLGYTKERGV